MIGVALSTHLAVSYDIDTSSFLIPNGQQRCIILGLREPGTFYSPEISAA